MQKIGSQLAGLLLSTFVAGLSSSSGAVVSDVQQPIETVVLRPSNLPGFAIAAVKCSICHSVDYVAYQPPDMNQTQWTAEMTKMKNTYGAPLDASDIRLVGIYLTVAYGDANSVSATDLAQVAPASAEIGSSLATHVQTLLDRNACLSCHALQQKLVGPAYRDVAAKYRTDAEALSKVEAGIRQGGAGRWGSVPMPPFPALSESELKALATFVLEQ